MESSSPTFPDASLPETLDEAFDMAKEAIEGWIECTVDDGQDIPKPSAMEEIRKIPNSLAGSSELLTWTSQSFQERQRVNITLPRLVLRRLDAKARQAGDTRSGYIAQMVMSA